MTPEPRPYRMRDREAIELCDTVVLSYEANMAAFAAVDSDYDAAFATAWRVATTAFLNHPTHDAVQDDLTGLGLEVDKTMTRGNKAVAAIRYYAQQAFEGTGIYRTFLFDRNRALRQRPADYAVYLRALHRKATVHQAALQAKGLTPAHMQELMDAADAILAAELDHEAFKFDVAYMAHQRVALCNAMWAYIKRLNAAADVVFADDPIKRALFNLG